MCSLSPVAGVTIGRPGGYPLSSIFQNSFDGFFCMFGVSPGYFYPLLPDNNSTSDTDSSNHDNYDRITHEPTAVTVEPSSEPTESMSSTSAQYKHSLQPSNAESRISNQPSTARTYQPLFSPSTIKNVLPSDPSSTVTLIPASPLHGHDDFHPHPHQTRHHKPTAKPHVRHINHNNIYKYHTKKVHYNHESEYAATPRTPYYYDQSECHCTSSILVYIVLYVICTIIVLQCINKLLDLNYSKLSQIMLLNICVSVSILIAYDIVSGGSYGWFGSHLGIADVLSAVLLLVGVYIYGSQQEPEAELNTNSVPVVMR